ncbi:hypothetical protein OMO38_19665 [Chryseobacterium sp. 09-1422]|uniref:Uncharacterized protein n=1 Tax=Chryseobacterium kimseyorum TaxID=2984028 RepID=A0ABT3I456_9FLAO|nr:hypothetical protein [Chryseobacterium kimseyorum]MCW3170754.1 hypothetical protein [Chryseobacterium kimseyorum]
MKSSILSILHGVKMVDFIGKSKAFLRVFIFPFLFLQVQFLYAQDDKSVSSAVISVSSGSKIFSADESFNQQIKQGKITVKNASVEDQKSAEKEYLVIVHKRISKISHGSLASQIKNAEAKKKSDFPKKLQKQIASRKALDDQIREIDRKYHHSSDSFSKSRNVGKHYVNERTHQQDQKEISADEKRRTAFRAIDYLYSQKFYTYNNRSINYCYTKVFSVRPPPFSV